MDTVMKSFEEDFCLKFESERKKEIVWGGSLPGAAASTALSRAIIMPSLRGSEKASPAPALDGVMTFLLHILRHWSRARDAQSSAKPYG